MTANFGGDLSGGLLLVHVLVSQPLAVLELVLLGAPFTLNADCGWWDRDWVDEQTRDRVAAFKMLGGDPAETADADAAAGQATVRMFRDGCVLHGVILHARRDGVLTDKVDWLATVGTDRVALNGNRSKAGMRQLVDNLAAAVAWGKWKTPAPTRLPAVLTSADRKALKKSAARRDAAHDSFEVNIIRPRGEWAAVPKTRPEPKEQRPSPRPHVRAAHWHRHRVGHIKGVQGVDWDYKPMWHAAVFVGGGPDPDRTHSPATIYHVPAPAGLAVPEPPDSDYDFPADDPDTESGSLPGHGPSLSTSDDDS